MLSSTLSTCLGWKLVRQAEFTWSSSGRTFANLSPASIELLLAKWMLLMIALNLLRDMAPETIRLCTAPLASQYMGQRGRGTYPLRSSIAMNSLSVGTSRSKSCWSFWLACLLLFRQISSIRAGVKTDSNNETGDRSVGSRNKAFHGIFASPCVAFKSLLTQLGRYSASFTLGWYFCVET